MSDVCLFEGYVCARVSHVCDHCTQWIMPGTTYIKSVGVADGDFGMFKCHQDCALAAAAVRSYGDYLPEEFIILHNDASCDDEEWMRKDFPAVADRLFGSKEGTTA
ncbi:MAG: hypothetical protein KDK08_05935 [Rhizobiaceae bacterium]|nr:hypothetical protein [Rhizobiaceae bacterium]MCC0000999.1 hypothetical protein [Methylobacteriaceae bacterium]